MIGSMLNFFGGAGMLNFSVAVAVILVVEVGLEGCVVIVVIEVGLETESTEGVVTGRVESKGGVVVVGVADGSVVGVVSGVVGASVGAFILVVLGVCV